MWPDDNSKYAKFRTALRRACFQVGPGDHIVLVLSDDEFWQTFGERGEVSRHLGYPAVLFDYWGTKVYVTCPRLSGLAVPCS